MFKDQPSLPAPTRLILCWRKIQDGYAYLNIVTHHVLGAVVKTAIVAYFLACLLLLALRYAVLPNIGLYKTDIEQVVTHAIGQPVSIATLHASWDGLRPRFSLGNVVIRDKAGREALTLPEVSATLSWWSAVLGQVRLQNLEIDRPDLDVRRDADGSLYVAGILVPTEEKGDGKMPDWVLSQHEIVIRSGTVRWNDIKRGAPQLQLNDVNLVLRNHWQHHVFDFKATPPAALATPIDLRAEFDHPPFSARISDPSRWKGTLYADLRNTDLGAWNAYIDYPLEVQQGHGSIRAWLDFDHAKVADLTADLALADTAIRFKDLPVLDLQQASGRISLREDIDHQVQDGTPTFGTKGHAIALTNFSMRTRDGLLLPTTTVSESYRPAKNGAPAQTAINATLLDLQTLASFAERLPLNPEQLQMLTDFAPRGQLRDFSAQWQGDYPALSSYDVKGQFFGLSVKAQAARPARPRVGTVPAEPAAPVIPGFENLTGQVAVNGQGGSISLNSENLQLELPGVFVDPIMPIQKLAMQADWTFPDKGKIVLHVSNMDFMLDGLAGSLSGTHLMSLDRQQAKSPGVIDLTAHVATFDVAKIGRYLPAHTPEQLRAWLTSALVSGSIQDGSVRLKGDLKDFPFNGETPGSKPKGEFTVVGKIVGGNMLYAGNVTRNGSNAPLWPLLEDIQGTIAFDRTRLEINAEKAKTHGVGLSAVKATIDNVATENILLKIDGSAAGSLQEFVGYTKDSLVQDMLGGFTDQTKANGSGKLTLKLELPLAHMQDTKVQGRFQFANDEINLFPGLPTLFAATGTLEFSEKSLNLSGIRANFLGGPVTISGGGLYGALAIKADGSLTSDGLHKFATGGAQKLAERVIGGTRYNALISVKPKRSDIVVESNLAGLALNLPSPLHKEANESMPVKFEMVGLSSADPAISREEIRLALGTSIAARYEREKPAERNGGWRLVHGAIGVNVPPAQPAEGLLLNVNLKTVNVDAWLDMIGAMSAYDKSKETGAADGLNFSEYLSPDLLAAHATEMIVFGRKLDNVVLGATLQKQVWQANIDSAQASGYVTYAAATGQNKGSASARLSSLIIPQAVASEVTELLTGKNTSSDIPALDIVADNFELLGKHLGRLELMADNQRTGGANEWRINKLTVTNPDAVLKATGKWVTKDGESLSNLIYTLDMTDAGRLLGRMGFPNILRGGKGKMDGDIKWKGAPYSLDPPSLSGQVHLDMASGQFLPGDPGATKLLGVLSLQSLPRRLTFDFRDVFSEGFAFDSVNMNATIAKGVLSTNNLKMLGVEAVVLLDGSADIDKETENLHVVIVPKVDAGAATAAYALVNPILGATSFLAQWILRDPLSKAFTKELQVIGPWSDPKVIKLDRKGDNTSQAATPAANVESAK